MTGIRISDPFSSGFDDIEIDVDHLPNINLGAGLDLPGVLGGGFTPLGASPIVAVDKDWDPPNPNTAAIATVTGRTLAQAGANLQKLGEWGRGGGAIRNDPNPVAAIGGFKVKLRGNLVKRLPRWDGYDQASAAAKAEWDRMISKLDAHEQRHLDIAIEECDACAADLIGRDVSQVAARVTLFNGQMRARQQSLDLSTANGSKEGVSYGDVILDISIE